MTEEKVAAILELLSGLGLGKDHGGVANKADWEVIDKDDLDVVDEDDWGVVNKGSAQSDILFSLVISAPPHLIHTESYQNPRSD